LIEIIIGENELLDEATYNDGEIDVIKLLAMPLENLQMIEVNVKNNKQSWRKRNKKTIL
jgi:hypothetical protein